MAVADTTMARLDRSAADQDGRHDRRLVLSAGPMRAVIRAAAGGRVAALWREDPKGRRVDVLAPMQDGPFSTTDWPKAGLYPLVPFSNRVRNARFAHGGREVSLTPHPGALPHAVHGFSHRHAWQATTVHDMPGCADLRFAYDPAASAEGWHWAFEARQRFTLDGAGLTHEIALTNRSSEPMPAGLGTHPFFALALGDRVRFSIDGIWEQDAAGCATRLVPLQGRDRHVEHVQTAATRTLYGAGFDGMASIERRDGTRILLQTGAPLDQIVFYVPPGGASCCIEPVSHVADAFNLASRGVTGTGARVLAPGETLQAMVRIGLA